MQTLLIILFNAVLTSTILCLAERLNHNIPLGIKRSFCFRCQHQLSWYDLIPVISAILLHGHCRHCQFKFGMHYAHIELLGAMIGWSLFSDITVWITAVLLFFLSCEDIYSHTIHIGVLYPWLIYLFMTNHFNQFEDKITVFCLVIPVCLCLVYRHKLGFGDIPILLCFILINDSLIFAYTLLIATILGLTGLLFANQARLPFVPYLLAGWLIANLGEKAISYFVK
ncbi:prepilin peptidase [Leuconostoc citreum]|uniref:prepilin peptidase n=1 Tax=Leuconostoc citreum TaxID=33964 RepID=UPI0032DEAF05